MNAISRLVLVGTCLVLAMSTGVGCAKKQVEAEPKPQVVAPKAPTVVEKSALDIKKETLSQMVFFAYDSSVLSPAARENLQKKADILKGMSDAKLVIEGHCDERGTPEYNMALGTRRAKAAKDFLVLSGVAANRLSTVSYGEERPLDPGHNETSWAKNRRDEFKLN